MGSIKTCRDSVATQSIINADEFVKQNTNVMRLLRDWINHQRIDYGISQRALYIKNPLLRKEKKYQLFE